MSQEPITGNKTIAKNATMLYIRMFFTMAISFYTSRIVLEALGVSDYGIFNVVGGLIVIINVLTGSLGTASTRFITFSLGKDNLERQKIIFSTTFFIHLFLSSIFFVLAETIGIWLVNNYLVIPQDRIVAANWVFQASVFSTIVEITQAPYNASITAHEKMGVFAYFSIFNALCKLGIAILVLFSNVDHLIIYSILYTIVSISFCIFYRLYCISHFEECHIKKKFDKLLFKEILSFSTWNLLGSISFNLYSQGRNVLINVFFGTLINAAVGIAGQVQGVLYTFVQNITIAFQPQIVKAAANRNYLRVNDLVCMGTKFTTLLTIIMTAPFFFHLDYLLDVWLEEVPVGATSICQVLLFANFMNSSNPFVYIAITAFGKIMKVNVLLTLMYIIVFILMYVCIIISGSYLLAFIVGLICSPISCTIYLFLLKKQMPIFSIRHFLLSTYFPVYISFIILLILMWGISKIQLIPIFSIVTSFFICFVVLFALSYLVILGKEEKKTLSTYVGNFLHKK